jgi:hypothetical protein
MIVPKVGVEPTLLLGKRILSPPRLPVPPLRLEVFVHGLSSRPRAASVAGSLRAFRPKAVTHWEGTAKQREMATGKRPRAVWQPDQPKKQRRQPTPLGALVAPAREEFARRAGLPMDRERWRHAVGDRIAARTEPGWLKGSVLTVVAASAAWAQELSLLSEEIRRRLAQHGLRVEGIRFVVRDGAGYQYAAQRRPVVTREALPAELREKLATVSDPELAAAIAEAAGFALGNESPRAAERPSELPRARDPRDAGARSARSGRNSGRGPAGS